MRGGKKKLDGISNGDHVAQTLTNSHFSNMFIPLVIYVGEFIYRGDVDFFVLLLGGAKFKVVQCIRPKKVSCQSKIIRFN